MAVVSLAHTPLELKRLLIENAQLTQDNTMLRVENEQLKTRIENLVLSCSNTGKERTFDSNNDRAIDVSDSATIVNKTKFDFSKMDSLAVGLPKRSQILGSVQFPGNADPLRRGASTGSLPTQKTKKWHNDAGSLWPPPRIVCGGHEDDEFDTERDMTWSELFFDLIFAVAIAKLNEQLRDQKAINVDVPGFIVFFMQFWSVWYEAAFYSTRFGTNDLPNMLFFSAVMGCVCFMTIHLEGGEGGVHIHGFAISAAAARLVFLVVYFRVWAIVDDNKAWGAARAGMSKCIFMCFCYCLAGFMHDPSGNFAWRMFVVASVVDLGVFNTLSYFPQEIWCSRKILWECLIGHPIVPWHLEHINERIGLLVIIFLGDSIEAVTSAFSSSVVFSEMVVAGFILVSCLKNLYFDVDIEDIQNHAVRRHRVACMIWFHLLATLCFGIVILGVGLSLICGSVAGEEDEHLTSQRQEFTCYGLAITLVSLSGISCCHQRPWHNKDEESEANTLLRRVFWMQQAAHTTFGLLICAAPRWKFSDTLLLWVLAAFNSALVVLNLVDEVIDLQTQPDAPRRKSSFVRRKTTTLLARKSHLANDADTPRIVAIKTYASIPQDVRTLTPRGDRLVTPRD